MDTAAVMVTAGSVIVVEGMALVRLWLRLRWGVRQEEARRVDLPRVARAVAAGSRVHLDEQRAGGHRLRVTITRGGEAGRAA